jgi:hypothetical protein
MVHLASEALVASPVVEVAVVEAVEVAQARNKAR